MSNPLSELVRQRLQEPRGRSISTHFTLSVPGSENSSRDSSPASQIRNGYPPSSLKQDVSLDVKETADELPPGRRSVDVYDATLPPWRAAIRRKLVRHVQRESELIASLQSLIRSPWLDAYFVYSSSLGTHTFFMILLPAFFFFGYKEMGLGCCLVLALGIYITSFLKDLICSPRPFAPPVTRLTIGTHHLEYGFPSTHSTNCVSMALLAFSYAHRLASTPKTLDSTVLLQSHNSTNIISSVPPGASASLTEPGISPQFYSCILLLLSLYAFSIVFGRIYTAMHCFTDCIVGATLGAGIWWFQTSWEGIPLTLTSSNPLYRLFSFLWPNNLTNTGVYILHLGKGLGGGRWLEQWTETGGWEVPLILIPLGLLAVNQHPQPVDDCPCFEDAIAIGSVVLGALVANWAMNFWGLRAYAGKAVVVMPGSGWVLELGQWVQVQRTMWDVIVWWSFACLKMIVGILIIFVWRILAKSALHLILPPTFRGLARVFRLPNRRFYTPATDYKSVPSEFSGDGLHPIPSVIDLPSQVGFGTEVGGIGSGVSGISHYGSGEIKIRGGMNQDTNEKGRMDDGLSRADELLQVPEKDLRSKEGHPVKHYDADVLTKVVVYAGIAVLACEVIPAMFEFLGWGVHSSI